MGREGRERREGYKDTTALGLDAATFDPSSHFLRLWKWIFPSSTFYAWQITDRFTHSQLEHSDFTEVQVFWDQHLLYGLTWVKWNILWDNARDNSGNEMGEVTNSLMISAASLNLTHSLWLYSWLRKVIRLLYLLLCRAALYTCKVSIATLS